ncbi:O-methyltransferase MdmC-like protein [Cladobotryum mycophilum]|uniref:O-methyltransferase MdmC-like protein n=1 Tax=Cladobotryum mycophilum TaxID=491253 RepID=A0ABR0SRT3_9HYPO
MKKPDASALYPNEKVATRVMTYAENHSTALPKHIAEYHAWVSENHERAGYMISTFQAQAHVFLARAFGAKRVLEVGSFVGFSALVWAHAVGKDGKVTGMEFVPEYAAKARETFQRNDVTNVEILEGDALQILSTLKPDEPYDLIFIDAQKSGYPDYLKDVLAGSQPGSATRLLRPGGIIMADNVLRRAMVVDESEDNPWAVSGQKKRERSEYENDRDLAALRKFNDAVASNERLEAFLMPLYDGIGLARLVD